MNQTSRTDEPYEGDGLNQSPSAFSNDLVTNQDLNGIANAREQRGRNSRSMDNSGQPVAVDIPPSIDEDPDGARNLTNACRAIGQNPGRATFRLGGGFNDTAPDNGSVAARRKKSPLQEIKHTLFTFGKFVGPGFLVAVAYIDPGNYSTDISAGAENQFRLLFIILMSNLFAIFLQCLSIKLGTVTGLNLAEACRAYLPKWLNYFLYFLAEAAIIATDIAEVIGTAIGLNLLIPKLPLVAGCAISILDVMVILFFYRPDGSMKGLRMFEFFVMLLVMAVVVCFCIQLSLIQDTTAGEVFLGYVPNDSIAQSSGLFQACGILGATVMPHSLYLGSGIVQSRLKDFDEKSGLLPPEPASASSSTRDGKEGEKTHYVPSLSAIKHSLKYSYAEVALSLFSFALFVNSAILIVAGASLYNNPDALEADIFGIHDLLSASISPAAGTIFALALLFSGVSAGIVCTISGQMICEGALRWKVQPWLRRLVTRSIAITPSIIIAGAAGRDKLNAALNGSQVALSVVLPFVTAPLIWFTCFDKYMRVQPGRARYKTEGKDAFIINGVALGLSGPAGDGELGLSGSGDPVRMANPWYISVLAGLIWLILVVMNVANLVLLGLGN
ncbi:natural resistance-associated macrophage protein [Hypoxylon rubiginosum]|uniref:Natural resistance-associated macrophage protein n=1 Tax=Hypoxylon rubiginosum TaxID=110542 RepID=A0ACC0D7V3_9PEZI|nr:natural resistance-associated macrophage protein [Hypoxylon rubiginosum]